MCYFIGFVNKNKTPGSPKKRAYSKRFSNGLTPRIRIFKCELLIDISFVRDSKQYLSYKHLGNLIPYLDYFIKFQISNEPIRLAAIQT